MRLSPADEALVKSAVDAVRQGAEAVCSAKDTEALRNDLYRLMETISRASTVVRDAEDRTREREIKALEHAR